jgi:hypothetical protein
MLVIGETCLRPQRDTSAASKAHLQGKKMETVQVYKTSDNKFFENLIEARQHENLLKHKPEIAAFMKSEFCEYKGSALQTIIERTLASWVMWKEKS